MKTISTLCTLLIALFVFPQLKAQSAEWHYFSKSERINDIAEDDDHIWISDWAGVTKIDKSTGEKSFLNALNSAIPQIGVWHLLVNANGDSWYVNSRIGITWNKGNKWEFVDYESTPLTRNYKPHDLDENGKLWFADTVLFSFDGTKWMHYPYPSNLETFRPDFVRTHGSEVWLATTIGLLRFIDGKWTHFEFPVDKSRNKVYQFEIDSKGTPWTLYRDELFILESNKIRSFHSSPEKLTAGYSCFYAKDKNNVWLGTAHTNSELQKSLESGAYHFNGSNWTFYSHKNSNLKLHDVGSIFIDDKNAVWFGGLPLTDEIASVVRKDGEKWELINHSQSELRGERVTHVMPYKDGVAMFYTGFFTRRITGLMRYSYGKWKDSPIDLTQKGFLNACADEDGNVYIRYIDKIVVHSKTGTKEIEYASSMQIDADAGIDEIVVDGDGNIWVDYISDYIEGKGLVFSVAYYNGTEWKEFEADKHLTQSGILGFGKDNKGTFCVLSNRKFYRFKGTGFEKLADCPSNFPAYSMPFIQDNDGSFWFPGYDVDLFEFNGSNWTEHANILGRNQNANNGRVLLAPNGDIWLRFGHGYVYSFDGSSWTEIIGPNKPKERAHLYSMEFDEHGNTWFGTNYGVMVYNAKGVTIGTEEPIKPNRMGLFPNPFTDQLNMVLPKQAEKVEVEIFSLTGQKVFERTYQQTDTIILENLHLPEDLYLVVATTQDGTVYSEPALLVGR